MLFMGQVNFRKITTNKERYIMNNIKTMLVALIAIFALSTSSFAGSIGVGIAGHQIGISADGTETPGGTETGTENSVKSATAGNQAFVGSYFLEYNFGDSERFTLGVDVIPGSAKINNKTLTRVDGASGDSNDTAGTKGAQATIENHNSYYAEFVVGKGIYLKAAMVQLDVKTQDTTTGTGTFGAYGDTSIDGTTYAIGQKGLIGSNGFYKIEGYTTDYDKINLTQSGASTTGTSTNSSLTANLDVVGAAFRVGLKF
jgi:hypothetical protein